MHDGAVVAIRGQDNFRLRIAGILGIENARVDAPYKIKPLVFKDVSFGKDGNEGLDGAMGVLEWAGPTFGVEIVNEDWLKQMRSKNWEQVWAGPIAA